MLAFLGLSTLDELFAAVPEAVKLQRALELADGAGEPDVLAHMEQLRRPEPGPDRPPGLLRRRRRLRPRDPVGHPGPGRPVRVRDLLHALPARGGPGRAAGRLRVPDHGGPASPACRCPTPRSTTGAAPPSRRSTSASAATGRQTVWVSEGIHPALAPDARHLRRGHRPRDPHHPPGRRRHGLAGRPGRADEAPGRGAGRLPELPRLPRGPGRRPGPVRPHRRADGGGRRPAGRRAPALGRRLGRRRDGGGGAGVRHRPRLRRSLPRALRLQLGPRPPPARPAGGRDRRRRGPHAPT